MSKREKIIVLVAEGCPSCTQLKGKIDGDKRFQLMDVTTNPEARQLAKKLGVTGVPTFLYPNKKSGEICALNDNGKVEKCIRDEHHHGKK